MSSPAETHLLETIRFEFERMKNLADKALIQISDEEFNSIPFEDGNSCAFVVQHLSGNLLSRFTDFLTSDGEKDWRNRDDEFEKQSLSREELMLKWEAGWSTLFATLSGLSTDHLLQNVYIRKEPLTVLQALMRQISHYSYHCGQIVTLARWQKGANWQSLSIPRGKSTGFAGNYLKP
ncbi:MAG: DinB family protein [Bacteroidia bacterium]